MPILGVVAVLSAALRGLAIYAIKGNNKISEMEGPTIVLSFAPDARRKTLFPLPYLQILEKDLDHIKSCNYMKDANENPILVFTTPEGKMLRIIICGQVISPIGNNLTFCINPIEVKGENGEYKLVDQNRLLSTLGFNKNVLELPSPAIEKLKTEQVNEKAKGNSGKSCITNQ
ncbi:MAG: hypothetical protein PV340_02620 [Wolbachia sp.]|nr:hypothetical protein [Wolbachia sp.]MDD9336788.1 hypothetical protein [Wolbachia sp.]